MRTWLALLAGALLLAGCGGGSVGLSAGSGVVAPDRPAPPISAVDRAPSALTTAILNLFFGDAPAGSTSSTYCWGVDTIAADGTTSSTDNCSGGHAPAGALAELKKQREALRPDPATEPRVVATLALAGGGTASFTAWTTAAGAPCWLATPDDGGGGGPAGPCTRVGQPTSPLAPSCDALCVSSSGSGPNLAAMRYLLAGTVPAGAEAIRVTLDDGSAATYPLDGPTLLGLRDRRILMLDLGEHDWRTLELVENGEVVRAVEMPKAQAAFEDCRAKVGPPPHPPGPDTQMQACLRASGALASSG